jgi:hypothetical protein
VGSSGIPEVKVVITGEDRGVAAAIKELSSQLKSLKSTQQEVAESSLSLSSAMEGFGAIVAGLKIIEFAKDIVTSATSMARLSTATGISAGTLSVYRQAASDAGVSQDKVNTGMIRLSSSIVKPGRLETERGRVSTPQHQPERLCGS